MLGTDVVVAFPMSTFIYANLISILNVLCVYVCVSVCRMWVYACVCVCVNTMKIHFTLPSCLGFYLLFVVVATVVWQKYFFLYCFLSDLISEWML